MSIDNTINFETYKKTRCIEESERYQRILDWKVETQIEFIKKGKISDAADCLRATMDAARNTEELNNAKRKAVEVISKVAELGYADAAMKIEWLLQKYLKEN